MTVQSQTIDRATLRKVFGTFVSGVTIVTCLDDKGEPRGLTANSFTSVSLDPPLVLVSIDKKAHSIAALLTSPSFAVNILADTQKSSSNIFASKTPDKFSGVDWANAETTAPIFADSLGWLDCRQWQTVDAGDHVLIIGEVVALSERTGKPLGYFRGGYLDLALEQQALDAAGDAAYGAVVEYQGRILLKRDPVGDHWGLPETARRCAASASAASRRSLSR